jgi:SAM-dependent methyltransferase
MDNLSQTNRERWNALVRARNQYTRPFLTMDPAGARQWYAERVDFVRGPVPEPAGKAVLCLAGGGGQQTAAFGLMGARVTVFDLSDEQLARDREAAAHLGYEITAVQGDMRHLSPFPADHFDLVWHPYSINFIDDARRVIAEVGRVIRPGGFYHLQFSNPFWTMEEEEWSDAGYPLRYPYRSGTELSFADDHWTFEDDAGRLQRVLGPREFVHTLSDIFNGLLDNGFTLAGFQEGPPGDPEAAPGAWEHLITIVPPFFTVAARQQR